VLGHCIWHAVSNGLRLQATAYLRGNLQTHDGVWQCNIRCGRVRQCDSGAHVQDKVRQCCTYAGSGERMLDLHLCADRGKAIALHAMVGCCISTLPVRMPASSVSASVCYGMHADDDETACACHGGVLHLYVVLVSACPMFPHECIDAVVACVKWVARR
jgi:hypothetical protein